MTKQTPAINERFERLRITEGYVDKGGVNQTTRIVIRPPAPRPMTRTDAGTAQAASVKTR